MNHKENNKFSFGKKEGNEIFSSTATPKFTSIEYKNGSLKWADIKHNQLIRKQYKQETADADNDKRQQYETKAPFQKQKINKLTLFDTFALLSVRDISSDYSLNDKSIRSVPSLKTKDNKKVIKVKKIGQNRKELRKTQSQNNFQQYQSAKHNISHTKSTNSHDNILRRFKSLDKMILPYFRKNYFFPTKRIKNNELVNNKTENNLNKYAETTEWKNRAQKLKIIPSFELSSNITHNKGNFFQIRGSKPGRPVNFHSQARVMTNDKIQLISKHKEQLQKCNISDLF